nr:insulin-like growth factor-binding protein-like 1 [Macaca nemestrina]
MPRLSLLLPLLLLCRRCPKPPDPRRGRCRAPAARAPDPRVHDAAAALRSGTQGRGSADRPRGASGLVCASRAAGAAPEGTGLCVCAQRGTVCGSDGRSYPSVCALRLRARHKPRAHPGHLHKARDGPCEFAPVVVVPPRSVHNVTGAQVGLSCEVRAVPTPVITWRKVMQSPEGTQALEELPGDHVNIAVQVRGGPSDHEATAWILINPLRKEDEGVYQCHAANMVGEAESHSTVTVLDLSKYRSFRFPAPDDRM